MKRRVFREMSKKISMRAFCPLFTRKASVFPSPKMPAGPEPKAGSSPNKQSTYEEVLDAKQRFLNQSLKPYYKDPLLVHSAQMQWIFDNTGKRYLDLLAGVVTVSVGHCHPRLVKVIREQSEKLWHTTQIYVNPQVVSYAEKLASKFPDPLKVVYLLNSGSEATDMAMLLARAYTGNTDIVGLRNCYHGMSLGSMGLTSVRKWNFNVPNRHGIVHMTRVDPYQGDFGGAHCRDSLCQVSNRPCSCGTSGPCAASQKYLENLQDTIEYLTSEQIAAFYAEGIQGAGGCVQLPKGFIKGAYEIARKHGGVCVSDEVQTGFGRLGSHYWSFQAHDAVPDIVTMAKGIGNGFPLAAVVTTPEIASTLGRALFFNTYGGNPMASAVGEEVLNIIDDEKLQENSKNMGDRFMRGLMELRDEFEQVGDVRGKGLMLGIELVENKETQKPLNQEKCLNIFDRLKDNGVLVGKGGPFGTVYRVKPPMCINAEDVDFALGVFRKVFKDNIY